MAKAIGTLGTVDTLTVGGRVFTDLTTLIVLCGENKTNTNFTFRKPGGTSGYQVTAGKTLTIYAGRIMACGADSTTASNIAGTFGYADADVGLDSATAFTNAVWQGGSSSIVTLNMNVGRLPVENGGIFFPVVAAKYPMCAGTALSGSVQYTAFGYEA